MKKGIKDLFDNNTLQKRYTVPKYQQIGDGNVIYFLQGDVTGMIKIGQCRNLQMHIKNDKANCSEDLTLLGKMNGDYLVKHNFINEFAHLRAHDDWFHSDIELVELIKSLKVK